MADANLVELPAQSYDCVFGAHSIHHLERLEHVFATVRRALKPGGLFILNEFVGPSRFQWTERQLEAANGLLVALPARFRLVLPERTEVRETITRPEVDEMIRIDPSEAVRSSEIVSLLPRYFEIAEIRGYGGTVLFPLLEGIAGNFADDDEEAASRLDEMFATEERLIATGALTDDFALIVARRR